MSSSSANMIRRIPRFWRQNYVYHVARILSNRDFSLQTHRPVPYNFSVTPVRLFSKVKDSTSAEVFLEEAFDEDIEGAEHLDTRNLLFPNSTDPHMKALASADSVEKVFEIFDQIEDLKPFHITQILATFHYLQKIATNVHHDFYNQMREKYSEFNDKILNHENFSSLLAKLEALADDMELEEVAVNLLFLRRIGVNLTVPVQVKLYLRLIHNVDQLNLKCISYFACALRPRGYYETEIKCNAWKFGLLKTIPRIEELLDCCTEPEELKQVAICYTNMNILISDRMMRKFAEKFKSFVEAGRYSSDKEIFGLKKVLGLVLSKNDWFNNNREYVDMLLDQHRGRVHIISPVHIFQLWKVLNQTYYPVQLYEEFVDRITHLMREENIDKGFSHVDLLSVLLRIKPFAIPVKDIEDKFRTWLESEHMANNIDSMYHIFLATQFSSEQLLDKYFEKSFEAVKHVHSDVALLAVKLTKCNSGRRNQYRNTDMEGKILDLLEPACLNTYDPRTFSQFFSILLGFNSHISDALLDKFADNFGQFDSYNLFQLHEGLRSRLLKQKNQHQALKNRRQQGDDYDALHEIFLGVSRASQALLTNKMSKAKVDNLNLLDDVTRMMRYFERNVTYEENHYKLVLDAFMASKDQLNLHSVKAVSGSLRLVSAFVEFPEIVDTVEQFYIDNIHLTKDISIRSLKVFLASCHFRNRPMKPELVEIISQNLYREMDLLTGVTILQVSYYLAALQVFPKFLAKEIFSSDFMTKLDKEMQMESVSPEYTRQIRNILMELNRCVVLQYPEYNVPWFHQTYCNQNIKSIAFTPDTNFKQEVYESLSSALGSWRYVRMNSYSEYFNPVHFELGLDAQGNLVDQHSNQKNIEKKIAIQVYDEHKYFRDTKKLKGEYQNNNVQLGLQGWPVLTISPFSWNSMFLADSSAREHFLKESVRAVSS